MSCLVPSEHNWVTRPFVDLIEQFVLRRRSGLSRAAILNMHCSVMERQYLCRLSDLSFAGEMS